MHALGKENCMQKKNKKKQVGHHARNRSDITPDPGADMCKTGSGAGKCAGAKSNTVWRRHAQTEDQAGREKRANTDALCPHPEKQTSIRNSTPSTGAHVTVHPPLPPSKHSPVHIAMQLLFRGRFHVIVGCM